jgi:hypothetical protein
MKWWEEQIYPPKDRGTSTSETIYMSPETALGVISSPDLLDLTKVAPVYLEESC